MVIGFHTERTKTLVETAQERLTGENGQFDDDHRIISLHRGSPYWAYNNCYSVDYSTKIQEKF